jgi:hypothetical protein
MKWKKEKEKRRRSEGWWLCTVGCWWPTRLRQGRGK